MKTADLKVALKRRSPLMAWVWSTSKFLREIVRAVRLLRQIGSAGRVSQSPHGETRGVVVFNMIRTYIPIQLVVEATLAMKLMADGYDVHVLYDDNTLCHHETLTRNDLAPFQTFYRVRRNLALWLLRTVPVLRGLLVPYSQFLGGAQLKVLAELSATDPPTYAGVALEPFVRASLVRFYLSAPDDRLLRSEPDYRRARTMFTCNAITSLAVARQVHEQLKPSLVVTSHGIYSTWGTFMAYMRDHDIRTVTYGLNGYAANSLDLAVNDVAANKGDGGYVQHLADEVIGATLSRLEVAGRVERMMSERFQGDSSDIARLGAEKTAAASPVLARLDDHRAAGRDIFALFPNVMWDNATTCEAANRVFASPVEWLVETVRYFAACNDKTLVIRVHPAERSWMPVRKSVTDILRFFLDQDTLSRDNIIVIPPDAALSSYSLFDYLRGGIVYNGTIGLELIFHHVPLIVGARAAYSDRGFTVELRDRDEYFAAFHQTQRILRRQDTHLDKALLFAYEYFFLHGVPIQLISPSRQADPDYGGLPQEMWGDRNLDHIVSVIKGERNYFQDHWLQGPE